MLLFLVVAAHFFYSKKCKCMKDIIDFVKRLWFVILMLVMVVVLVVMMRMA